MKHIISFCLSARCNAITPLGVAAEFSRTPLMNQLLAAGADVQKLDRKGNTVLHYAAN
jgi:ankyrin repeat protein